VYEYGAQTSVMHGSSALITASRAAADGPVALTPGAIVICRDMPDCPGPRARSR
jgi:hypothetical protein